jgi:hypothetical protein
MNSCELDILVHYIWSDLFANLHMHKMRLTHGEVSYLSNGENYKPLWFNMQGEIYFLSMEREFMAVP